MFAATFVAVVAKSVAKAVDPEVMATVFTRMVFTDPEEPPVRVTVPVAYVDCGVLLLMIEQLPERSIVNRSK